MPRTEYDDKVAEKQFQEARKSLGERLNEAYRPKRKDESVRDYDAERLGLESFQSGDYKPDKNGNYNYSPSKMRR